MIKKTKIVCTVGPSTDTKDSIIELLNSGMNVMRLNFSHGNYNDHKRYINNLKLAISITGKYAAILLDTKGPEIRTLKLKDSKEVILHTNQLFSFICNDVNYIGNEKKIGVSYKKLFTNVKVGSLILVDDGLISMEVIDINFKLGEVICKVLNSGVLGENKGINLPNISIDLPSLDERDKRDLIFGCKNKVDFIAVSFVRTYKDILKIRKFLDLNGGENIQIISKIESREGLKNFDEIINVSDGIMVARGDLGVEIPTEDVIFAQKMIIKKCNLNKKIVITATQMLESMIKNPRPTRAESGDVANAILDGTDAVMLSGESAKGNYPIEAVKTMCSICERADSSMINYIPYYEEENNKIMSISEAICKSSVDISRKLNSPLILVFTKRGKSARLIRKYFPKSLILALTDSNIVFKQLLLTKGVIPLLINSVKSTDDFYSIGKKLSISTNFGKKGDKVVMVSGALVDSGASNTMSVHIL